jgi:hypothetical protein
MSRGENYKKLLDEFVNNTENRNEGQNSHQKTIQAFDLKWNDDQRKFKVALKIFMENNKKPTIVKALGLIAIDLVTFQSIGNFGYTLFTFFKNMNKN